MYLYLWMILFIFIVNDFYIRDWWLPACHWCTDAPSKSLCNALHYYEEFSPKMMILFFYWTIGLYKCYLKSLFNFLLLNIRKIFWNYLQCQFHFPAELQAFHLLRFNFQMGTGQNFLHLSIDLLIFTVKKTGTANLLNTSSTWCIVERSISNLGIVRNVYYHVIVHNRNQCNNLICRLPSTDEHYSL
jgi:hypothetical protein